MENTIANIGCDAKRYFLNRSGLGNYSRDLVRLMQDYLPVNSISLYFGYNTSSNLKHSDTSKIISPKKWYWQQFPSLWRSYGIVDDIKEHKPSIYHGLSAELPYKKVAGTKYIVTVHDLIFVKHPEWYDAISVFIYKKKLKQACKNADLIICISEQTQRDLCQYIPSIKEKTRVVYQTCNLAFQAAETPDISDINIILNAQNKIKNYGICIGNIEERKNGLNIIRAVERVPNQQFIFIGSGGKYKQKLLEYVGKHNLSERIFFLEKLPFNKFYALVYHAYFSIYLSHYEGFGIPIIESLFCKKPVITNENGVFKEAAGDGGLYVYVNDIEQVAESIIYLNNNPIECKRLGEKGCHYVSKFRDAVVAKQLYEVYDEALNG